MTRPRHCRATATTLTATASASPGTTKHPASAPGVRGVPGATSERSIPPPTARSPPTSSRRRISANGGERAAERAHPPLHRHGDGGSGARAAASIRPRKCRRIISSSRTERSSSSSPSATAPGTPARASGRARATSTRPRSGSRSSIPATTAARRLFPNGRSRRPSRSRGTSLALDDFARAGARPFRRRAARASATPARSFRGRGSMQAASATGSSPAPISGGPLFRPGEEGPPVRALQAMLALYGYGLELTGVYDRHTRAVVAAFQRHFRPARVDGEADASTVATLKALIEGLAKSAARMDGLFTKGRSSRRRLRGLCVHGASAPSRPPRRPPAPSSAPRRARRRKPRNRESRSRRRCGA